MRPSIHMNGDGTLTITVNRCVIAPDDSERMRPEIKLTGDGTLTITVKRCIIAPENGGTYKLTFYSLTGREVVTVSELTYYEAERMAIDSRVHTITRAK